MTDLAQWREANDTYLAHSLTWLRLKLTYAAQQAGGGPSPPPASSLPPAARRRWRRGGGEPELLSRPALPVVGRVTEDEVRAAAAAMQEAASSAPGPPALEELGEQLGLSRFERQVLLLCVAPELDSRLVNLYADVQGSPHPTFALALAVLDEPSWDVRAPDRPLRFWHLVEVAQSGDQLLTTSPLRADERVVNALKGLAYLDDRLAPLLERVAPPDDLPPSQQAAVGAAVQHLIERDRAGRRTVIELVGPDTGSRRAVAAQIASELGLPLHRLPVELLPTAPADLELVTRLLHREAVLASMAVYLELDDVEGHGPTRTALTTFLSRARVLVLVGGHDVQADLPVPSVVLDVGRPTGAEQRAIWAEALGGDGPDVAPVVAQFDLDRETILTLAGDARAQGDEAPSVDDLWDRCRRHARPRLEVLAQRIEPKADWDQLVLPDAEQVLLRELADQVAQRGRVYEEWGFGERMNRGLGISALFAGESGTGKTMAAEVLATTLALDLYRIDLSSVVDKYIGETEKNLRRLFDAAERGGVILFFDEADALFGKRSEVKDAHDRYANIEISYLLQRVEAYRGLAILATNMKSSIDRAFTRRLRFIVTFPFPSAADRARMWQRVFPAGTPVGDLDVNRLSRLNLTGAGIRNAALNAAFLAARGSGVVTMGEVLQAARNELRKLERPINEADFRLAEAANPVLVTDPVAGAHQR